MPAESQRLILLDVDPSAAARPEGIELAPGAVLTSERKRLIVQAGDGKLEILRLRPEGKRAMSASEFLAGHPLSEGDHFDAAGVAG